MSTRACPAQRELLAWKSSLEFSGQACSRLNKYEIVFNSSKDKLRIDVIGSQAILESHAQSIMAGMQSPLFRRWFQFSLRTLLIVVTLLCLGPGGYLVYQQRLAQREEAAVAKVRQV